MTEEGAVMVASLVWVGIALLLSLGVLAAVAQPTKIKPVKIDKEEGHDQ